MPLQVRELTNDEVTRMFPQRGQMDLSEYQQIFEGAQAGKGFEVSNEGMSVRALKRRLGQAVKQALGSGYSLRYKQVLPESNTLAFVVKAKPPTPARNNGKVAVEEAEEVVVEHKPVRRRSRRREPVLAN